MLRVQTVNDIRRSNSVVNGATTLRAAFEAADMAYTGGDLYVNGKPCPQSWLDRTFDELGLSEDVRLTIAANKNNAK